MAMTAQNIVTMINLETDELLDTDEDNIQYINNAIDYLSFALAGIGDPEALQLDTIKDNTDVPAAFVDFVPKNGYPVNISGGKYHILDDSESVDIKYSVVLPHVTSLTDTMPIKDIYAGTIVLISSYLIKKKTYIPVEYCNEDKAFVNEVLASIRAAKGIAQS